MGLESLFHFMTFFDLSPNKRFGHVLALLAWFGYFSYFWSKQSTILKFGTKMGVKSISHSMTFFDWRPNNRAIDLFAFLAKVHCSSLEATEAPHFFFHLGDF